MINSERPPGDVAGIRGLATHWGTASKGAREAAATLRSASNDISGGGLGLKGDYAGKIRDAIAEVPDALEKLATGYGGCAGALTKYADRLENLQRDWNTASRNYDAQQVHVNAAKAEVVRLDPGALERLESISFTTQFFRPDLSEEVRTALQRYRDAKAEADRHERLAKQARELRDGAEGTCKREIEQALKDSGTKNLAWWEKAREWLKNSFTTWDGFVKFCETLGTVLAIVSLFTPLGPFLGAIAFVATMVAIADKVKKYANGELTLKDLALEVGMSLAQKVGGKYIGKGWKAWTKSAASKRVGASLHRGLDKAKIPGIARNAAHRGACAVTGHPVDIATGKVFTSFTDLELPGPLPLQFERVWYSTSAYVGPFGHGWHHTYDAALYVTSDAALYRTPDGRFSSFAPLDVGEEFYDRQDQWTITRDDGAYRVRSADGVTRRFTPTPQDAPPQDTSLQDETPQDATADPDPIQDRVAGDSAHGVDTAASEAVEEEPVMYLLREVVSRAGHRITLEYDDRDRLVQIIDSGGREIRLELGDAGRITALTAPHPDNPGERFTVATYAYTEDGDLAEMSDARGFVFSYGYTGHLLTRETDRTGLTFTFEYDAEGIDARCIRTSGDDNLYRRTLTYEPGVTVVVDSLGHTTRNEHDGVLVTRTINALGGTRATTYRDAKPIEETDELGRVTTYDYDWRGNLIQVTTPDGATVEVDFDENDQPVHAIDQVDGEWWWEYDDAGLLILRRDPLARVTELSYGRGLLEAIVDPAGGRTALAYDDQGSLVEVTTPDGAASSWRRNALGWPVAATDPLGNVVARTFDLGGNIVRVDEPDGNVRELAYDGESNLVSAIDELYDVRLAYQGMGRLAERTQAGTTVRFEYDTEEQLVGIVNEHGYVYSFTYGPTGLVSTERGFDGIMRIYERDIAGRVASVRRASGTITRHEYDDLDRVVRVAHSDGTAQRYAYRADGALMAAGNDTIEVTFERDVLGRLLRETQGSRWVASAYDELDRRIRMTSSMGADQTFTRNAMGDVMTVSGNGYSATFTRDELGQELTRSLPGGVEARWHRDRVGRPVRQEVVVAGGTIRERTYDWDVGGRLRGILDSMAGPVRYEHDGLGQLVSATYGDGRVELRMPDAVGNLFRTEDRSDREYGAAGQVLSLIDEHGRRVRYEYDPEGNLISKVADDGEIWRYRWAADGNMSAVERPDGTVVTFGYDALSRRVRKNYRGQTTHWVWDGDVILHEWVDGELESGPAVASDDAIAAARDALLNEVLRRGPPDRGTEDWPITWFFDPESFAPAARIQGTEVSSFVTDHLGTPHTLLSADGEAVWSGTQTTYGRIMTIDGAWSLIPFRFPGQYSDIEIDLSYNRNRFIDPEAGVFTCIDPLRVMAGNNYYRYPGDPVTAIDPLGLTRAATLRNPARVLEVGGYGDLSRRSVQDGLTPDHIPSNAAVLKYIERITGSTPTEAMAVTIRERATCLVIPTRDHAEVSPTFAGRNSRALIDADQHDLFRAAERDLESYRERMLMAGYSTDDFEAARAAVHARNMKAGIY